MNRLPILASLGLLALPCSAMALEAGPSSPQQAETEGVGSKRLLAVSVKRQQVNIPRVHAQTQNPVVGHQAKRPVLVDEQQHRKAKGISPPYFPFQPLLNQMEAVLV